MAAYTSTTDTTGLAGQIMQYYVRQLLEWLVPQTQFYKFAKKTALPKMSGYTVTFNRPVNIGAGRQLLQGTPVSTYRALSTQKVSALIEQYGEVINWSDMVDLTIITSATEEANKVLAQSAAQTVDLVIQQSIIAYDQSTGNSTLNYIKSYNDAYISTRTAMSAGASTGIAAISDIRAITTRLRALNVPKHSMTNTYVGIIHPNIVEDLMADTNWTTWNAYTNPEAMYNGKVGRVFDVEFYESPYTPISVGYISSSNVSASIYCTPIFGEGFYGVTELDGGVELFSSTGASKSDPLNQTNLLGFKVNMAAKLLNPSCGVIAWFATGETNTTQNITGPTAYSG